MFWRFLEKLILGVLGHSNSSVLLIPRTSIGTIIQPSVPKFSSPGSSSSVMSNCTSKMAYSLIVSANKIKFGQKKRFYILDYRRYIKRRGNGNRHCCPLLEKLLAEKYKTLLFGFRNRSYSNIFYDQLFEQSFNFMKTSARNSPIVSKDELNWPKNGWNAILTCPPSIRRGAKMFLFDYQQCKSVFKITSNCIPQPRY